MKKVGRNDPCPCGSGKKFKKCCESQMLGGKFRATKIESDSAASIQKTVGLTSLFQSRLSETPKKPPIPTSEPAVAPEESPPKNSLPETPLEEKEDI
jgi:hypothetical protein